MESLVDPDHLGTQRTSQRQLLAHVQLVHLLDGVPVEAEVVGHLLDRGTPALLAHIQREAFRVVRIRRQPVESLLFHPAADPAVDSPQIQLEIDTQIAAGQVAHSACLPVVPCAMHPAARPTSGFFPRRINVMTRPCASPTTSATRPLGTKPGNRNASRSSCVADRRELMQELDANFIRQQARFVL